MLHPRSRTWIVVALLSILILSVTGQCLADGPGTAGGDPADEAPACNGNDSLNPTAGQLGEFWMILMAMAFQLAL